MFEQGKEGPPSQKDELMYNYVYSCSKEGETDSDELCGKRDGGGVGGKRTRGNGKEGKLYISLRNTP